MSCETDFPAVRVRRLPNAGFLGRRRVFEIDHGRSPDGTKRPTTTTRAPYPLLKPELGRDEAALVVRRASQAWKGGVGPWCSAFSGAEELPAAGAGRATHPADAVEAFFAEHDGAGLKLPTGWFGRPYDNQHRLTRVEQTADALVVELDVWDWREYGSDTPHRETFHDGSVELVAPSVSGSRRRAEDTDVPEETLPEPLASLVDRLARAGLVPAAERGSGMVDHLIECRSPGFAVRLVIDRGQWGAEGGLPGGSEWYDADIWASCLASSPPAGLPPLEEQVDFFASQQEALALAAGQESTWGCLRRNRERRSRERVGLPPADE